jgi:hypothetical protein
MHAFLPNDRDIQHFAILDWKAAGDIVLRHIPSTINCADDLTKPLGYVLHMRHVRRLMGHYGTSPFVCSSSERQLDYSRPREGVELPTGDGKTTSDDRQLPDRLYQVGE